MLLRKRFFSTGTNIKQHIISLQRAIIEASYRSIFICEAKSMDVINKGTFVIYSGSSFSYYIGELLNVELLINPLETNLCRHPEATSTNLEFLDVKETSKGAIKR